MGPDESPPRCPLVRYDDEIELRFIRIVYLFPGLADHERLYVHGELFRSPHIHPCASEPYRNIHDRRERIVRGNGQKLHGLPHFFGYRHSMGEKELLVIGEKVFFENIAVSSPRPLDDPRGHHHDVGFRCIRFLESQAKMLKRLVVANRHQYGGGPDLKRIQVDGLLLNQLELIESCCLSLLAGDSLRDGEKREQSAREQDAADCCDLFGEQVNQRRGQKTA